MTPVGGSVVSLSRPGAYRTIAEALGAAGPSVVLHVEAGTYTGPLSVRDRTVVVRAVDGPGTVTLETRDGTPVVSAERSHVVLENVTLETHDPGTPTTVDVAGGVVELTGCAVTWRAGNGVMVTDGARAVVTRCRFDGSGHGLGFVGSGGLVEHCDFTGPDLCGVSARLHCSPEVRACTFRDVRYGFMAFQGAAGTVEDCEFTGVGDIAIGASRGSAPMVRRCRVGDGPGTGIFVGAESGGTFEDCVLTGLGGRGIALATTGAPVVRGCRVERPGKEGLYSGGGNGRVERLVVDHAPGTAVLIRDGGPELIDVSVTGGETGIAVTGDPGTRVRLVGGSVRDTSRHGLYVVGAATLIAERLTVSSRSVAAETAETSRLTLTDCTLGGGTGGVTAVHGSHVTLTGCILTDLEGTAVLLHDTAELRATATTVRHCAGDGIVCDSTGGAVLDNCDLTGVAGTPVTGSHADAVR